MLSTRNNIVYHIFSFRFEIVFFFVFKNENI